METEKGRKNFNIGGEKWRVLGDSIVFSDANKITRERQSIELHFNRSRCLSEFIMTQNEGKQGGT